MIEDIVEAVSKPLAKLSDKTILERKWMPFPAF
jgi:hypothetical protein